MNRADPQTVAVIKASLVEALDRRREANQIYTQCLRNAVQVGMNNTEIARTLGLSETAIRNWRKRHDHTE